MALNSILCYVTLMLYDYLNFLTITPGLRVMLRNNTVTPRIMQK